MNITLTGADLGGIVTIIVCGIVAIYAIKAMMK